MLISVVTPVYKAEEILPELCRRLILSLSKITDDFEIIMINDGSLGNDWEVIKTLAVNDKRIKGINLSKNFGQHFAITAGLDFAQGEWVVVMDCDLQDPPEEIVKLFEKANEGFEVVWARRYNRKDSLFKRLTSRIFISVFDKLSGLKSDPTVANFSIIKKEVVENFRKFRERNRAYSLFVRMTGFKQEYINFEHSERPFGKSSYNLSKLFKLAFEIIIAHSNKPLKISIVFGFLLTLVSLLYTFFLMIRYYTHQISVDGWTTVVVSVWFLAGLGFANMGLLGLYIGKIFDETKNRPLYIVSMSINFENCVDL